MLMDLLGYGFSAAPRAEENAMAKSHETSKMEIQDPVLPFSPILLRIADFLSYGNH
jgi:hypothetical protein